MHNEFTETKRFFDQMAASWDSRFCADAAFIEALLTLCPIPGGARIADIACGTGALFPFLLKAGPSEIVGVDISENMLLEASKKFSDPRIRLICGNFLDMEDASGFDLAFIYRAYPHFHDKAAFAKKLSLLLKPGGRFMIAHSEGRDKINGRHRETAAHVSDILAPADEEAKVFEGLFAVDIKADTDGIYIISGTKI